MELGSRFSTNPGAKLLANDISVGSTSTSKRYSELRPAYRKEDHRAVALAEEPLQHVQHLKSASRQRHVAVDQHQARVRLSVDELPFVVYCPYRLHVARQQSQPLRYQLDHQLQKPSHSRQLLLLLLVFVGEEVVDEAVEPASKVLRDIEGRVEALEVRGNDFLNFFLVLRPSHIQSTSSSCSRERSICRGIRTWPVYPWEKSRKGATLYDFRLMYYEP
jgi:hypothetical protein